MIRVVPVCTSSFATSLPIASETWLSSLLLFAMLGLAAVVAAVAVNMIRRSQ